MAITDSLQVLMDFFTRPSQRDRDLVIHTHHGIATKARMKRYFQFWAKYPMNTLKSEKGEKKVCTANNRMERGVSVSSCGPGLYLVSVILFFSADSVLSVKARLNWRNTISVWANYVTNLFRICGSKIMEKSISLIRISGVVSPQCLWWLWPYWK